MEVKELGFERNMPGRVLSVVYSVRGRKLRESKINKRLLQQRTGAVFST